MISAGPRWEAVDSPRVVPAPLSFPNAIDDGGGGGIEDLASLHLFHPHGEGTVCPPARPLKTLLGSVVRLGNSPGAVKYLSAGDVEN